MRSYVGAMIPSIYNYWMILVAEDLAQVLRQRREERENPQIPSESTGFETGDTDGDGVIDEWIF